MLLDEIKKIKSTPKELREFGLVVGGVLAGYASLLAWRHGVWNYWIVGIGAALILLGLIIPAILRPFQRAWMAAALVMGAVMSRVVLTLLFFIILTPVALVLRMQGKRLLERGNFAGEKNTFWNLRTQDSSDLKRCERQY